MAVTEPDTDIAPFDIRLFGTFEVRVYGRLLPPLRFRKARLLLALLVLHRGRPIERGWLAGILWPESSQSHALYNLRRRLVELRQALGDQAVRLAAPTSGTLCLDLKAATADVIAFDVAIERSDTASLQEAVHLYRGPLLEGCTETWVVPEREAREQAYLSALVRLAQQARQAGDPAEAARLLRRVVQADPLRESAQRDLMQVLAEDGDHAAIVQVYRDLRLLLHRDLHTAPDPETTALFQKLRRQVTAQAPARHTLSASLDVSSLLPRLPVQLTRFFGRDEEIARLHALLTSSSPFSPAPRLLTLTGPGGSGKTRLAIETGARFTEELDGAVCFVPLADLADAGHIPDAIVDALGLRRSPNLEAREQVLAFLNDLNRPTLLLLDNLEHLLPEGASLVQTLLERVPLLTLLVTSRQALNVEGEREFPVLPLPVPESLVSKPPEPELVLQCASAALLVDRMQARRSDFQVTPGNASALATLCRKLDGLPLALELAAGWARVLTPQQMLSQMKHGGAFLVSTRPDLPPRHRSLHAALEWSYRLLTPEQQGFFYRLSVFRGGWTIEAAEAVCGEPRAPEYLAQLVERSLVLAETQGEEIRFGMLETFREFGRERLTEAGEREAVRRRHRDWFLALAETAERRQDSPDHKTWLDLLETEHDNLREALRFCTASEEQTKESAEDVANTQAGLRLAIALGWFWRERGHLTEGRAWHSTLLSRPAAKERTQTRAQALYAAAVLAWSQGDFTAAHSQQKESLEIARERGDKYWVARSLNNLGNLARHQGDYAKARALWEECLALRRELGDRRGTAYTLSYLGLLARNEADDFPASQALLEESLALFQELQDAIGIAYSLGELGSVALWSGDHSRAAKLVQESLTRFKQLDDRFSVTANLNRLGLVFLYQGDLEHAIVLLEEALALDRELDNRLGIAWSLRNLGVVALHQGDGNTAFSYFAQSLAMHRERGDSRRMGDHLEDFGGVACAQGRVERAARLLGAAEAGRENLRVQMHPPDRPLHARNVAFVREALDETAFVSLWTEGRAMTLEQAVAYALDED